MQMSSVTELSELQSPLPAKCLPMPGKKINFVLMCVVPQMVSILRSTGQIRNFVRSSVWKCIDFSNALYVWRYI